MLYTKTSASYGGCEIPSYTNGHANKNYWPCQSLVAENVGEKVLKHIKHVLGNEQASWENRKNVFNFIILHNLYLLKFLLLLLLKN